MTRKRSTRTARRQPGGRILPIVLALATDGQTIAPTGKAFKLPMATIGRWDGEGGTMAEEWLFWDNQAFMKQIGLAE